MSTAAASSERRVNTLTRKLKSSEDENAALKDKLAQARKRIRLLGRGAATPTAANDALLELARAREEQQASAEVLRIVSSSVSDTKPVFDAIVASLVRVFEGFDAIIWLAKDDQCVAVSVAGPTANTGALPKPTPLNRDWLHGEAILDCKLIHVADIATDTSITQTQRGYLLERGRRTVVVVPLMRDGKAFGNIGLTKTVPTPVTNGQIALMQTFADQAVIAIENARLFKELEARNKDLAESLQHQAATSEVLRIVSQSFSDTKPVFDAIQQSMLHLFEGFDASVWLRQGSRVNAVAFGGPTLPHELPSFPLESRHPTPHCVTEGRVIEVENMETYSEIDEELRRQALARGRRSILNAPLILDGEAVGLIGVSTTYPTKFTDKQINLLQTFADQAVIAIQNVHLFRQLETRNKDLAETLNQQTATAEVLRIISGSIADAQPVFDAITRSAHGLFIGFNCSMWLRREDHLELIAYSGDPSPEGRPIVGRKIPISRDYIVGGAVLDNQVTRADDLETATHLPERGRKTALSLGVRCVVNMPLKREREAIGVLSIGKYEPTVITDKQVELLRTFANQAVIAIENARLFNELQSSLEHQTATGELLRAISRASFDLPSLLRGLTATAARLCDANRCNIFRPDGEGKYLPFVQYGYDSDPEALEMLKRTPLAIGRQSAAGRAVLDKKPVHIPDVSSDPEFRFTEVQKRLAFATLLAVPMLRDGEVIGVITMNRGPEPRPFNDKQMALVTAFADQAVIAIENVRLINEIQEKSAQLEIANRHKSEFLASMSHELRTPLNAIIGFSEVLSEKMFGEVNDKQMQYLKTINASGQHLLSLINDILDLAKIEAGRMDLDLTTFNVAAALDNAMTLIRERAGRQSVALEIQCDPELKEWTADERKFKQVMLNLLSNAVKFTPQGGRITVAAKRIDTGIEVSVTDTGVGIAPQDQAAVFEEFKQVGGDRLRKAEGTGLGLSLTRKFVELHGGQIGLASEPGKGSTFSFTLPESKREAA